MQCNNCNLINAMYQTQSNKFNNAMLLMHCTELWMQRL